MEFRDLKKQYKILKKDIDDSIQSVLQSASFISGKEVGILEEELSSYTQVKHCITCANGTDALSLILMALDINEKDAIFVPNFTFFASAEVISFQGATPIFVDVDERTFNIDIDSLERAIKKVISEGKLEPKIIIPVDLFGLCADYKRIQEIAKKYNLFVLEDCAQGFGSSINGKKACSFANAAITSFFPAKPLGCYGDGGAIFTNDDEMATKIRSLCVHGKGDNKYDNIRIGRNSRLDTIQAAILRVKLKAFIDYELEDVNKAANLYNNLLIDKVKKPIIKEGYLSSWAQYTIILKDKSQRENLSEYLKENGVPSMVYYPKSLSNQIVFKDIKEYVDLSISNSLCDKVLSLPIHPYIEEEEVKKVCDLVNSFIKRNKEEEKL